MKEPSSTPWDREYRRKGIPSSSRSEASGVAAWALANWHLLTGAERPEAALDVGCGTARNSLYFAKSGIHTVGFDASAQAIASAQSRISQCKLPDDMIRVFQHDLSSGLPFPDKSFDLVADIFVYKHQTEISVRQKYLEEVARVLRSEGRYLLSLAHREDGYYRDCADHPTWTPPNPRVVIDPIAGIGSVLFDQQEIEEEVGSVLRLEMLWRKIRQGPMHGQTYMRDTIATIWKH